MFVFRRFPLLARASSTAIVVVVAAMFALPVVASTATLDAQFVRAWPADGGPGPGRTGNGQFDRPRGIAVGPDGCVYVADAYNNRVQKFSASGEYLTQWGSLGAGDGQFNWPNAIAVGPDGTVYVGDTTNRRIQMFTSSGEFIGKWGSVGSGNGQFLTVYGMSVDSSGNVYTIDASTYRVQKFTASGNFVTAWGSGPGTGQGVFDRPLGIAVDSLGCVYVADSYNNRIQKFSSSGVFLSEWGALGAGLGEFDKPSSVAVDASGGVYVVDQNNHRVQEFSATGEFLRQWGSYGSAQGQFIYPWGAAIGSTGDVYVTDMANSRVEQFSLSAAPPVDETGHITGRVTDGSIPLAGIRVSVVIQTGPYTWKGSGTTTTGPDGKYDMGGLVTGIYQVNFTDPTRTHETRNYNTEGMTSMSYASPISVTAGQTTGGIDVVLRPLSGSIRGRVTDGTLPIAGITVRGWTYFGGATWGSAYGAVTRAGGTYEIRSIPPGIYELEFYDAAKVYGRVFYGGTPLAREATNISVPATPAVTGIDMVLRPGAHVRGTVSDGTGPIGSIGVTIYKYNERTELWTSVGNATPNAPTVMTAADGTYDIGALVAGSYRVTFSDPSGNWATQSYPDRSPIEAAEDIQVAESSVVSGIDATLAPASRIRGRVTDGANPLGRVSAQAWAPVGSGGWASVATTLTRSDGSYEINGLRAGTYRIRFLDQGQHATGFWPSEADITKAGPITVGTGSVTEGIDEVFDSQPAHITGTVTGRGVPLAGVHVRAFRLTSEGTWNQIDSTYTVATGRYDVARLSAGTYRILFNDAFATNYWGRQWFDVRPDISSGDDVEVTTGSVIADIDGVYGDEISPDTRSDAENSYIASATITLSASDDEGGSGVRSTHYRLDSSADTVGTSVCVSGEGDHELEFWSVDKAGNAETPHTVKFTVLPPPDTEAPNTVSDALDSYANEGTITLSASDDTGGSGVAETLYRLDDGAETSGTTVSFSEYGAHSLEFWSVDVAGNIEDHHILDFTVSDTIAPSTVSDGTYLYLGEGTITLLASDNTGGSGIASTHFRLDGGYESTGTSVTYYRPGLHLLEFWSVDNAGNVESHDRVIFLVWPTQQWPSLAGEALEDTWWRR